MKRLIIYFTLALLVFFVGGLIILRYAGNKPSSSLYFPVIVSSRGAVEIKRGPQSVKVETAEGAVEIALEKVYFLVDRNSRLLLNSDEAELQEGYVEYKGEGSIKIIAGEYTFSGEGFITPEGALVLSGQGTFKEIVLKKGEAFFKGKKISIPLPTISFVVRGSNVEINGPFPILVQISRKPMFVSPIYSSEHRGRSKVSLKNGVYYIRGCRHTPFFHCGKAKKIEVNNLKPELRKIDNVPPILDVTITPKGKVVIISGKTEVGVTLYINGNPVRVENDGNFYSTLEFDTPGIKQIVVEAVDSAGNITTRKKEVVVYGD